jgi:rubrerythrin
MLLLEPSILDELKKIKQPNVSDLPTVHKLLQQAIELEHATVPPYLYALYSLDASKNKEIVNILQSVVVEEMLHMTLASNVLNALGGTPNIEHRDFIPEYPGPLPGGVESQLIVQLAPFSIGNNSQLKTFLTIEEPENPIDYPVKLLIEGSKKITIGEFYQNIKEFIIKIGDSAFTNPPRHQVGPDLMEGSIVVTNVDTACQAIETIVRQGEGTEQSPTEPGPYEWAHYYRFEQINKGKELQKDNNGKFSYSGKPISLNTNGIYNAPINPKSSKYPQNSLQQLACNNFNYTYTSLLFALHKLVNGQATEEQFNIALGLMMSLKGQAKDMMTGTSTGGIVTGPSFEYQPVNPGNSA